MKQEWSKYVTPRERDDRYHELLAGGAKVRLFESFVDHGLASLLAQGPMPADAICRKLALHPHRTRKWLHLLNLIGLVKKMDNVGKPDHGGEIYTLTPLAQALFGQEGKEGAFYKDELDFFRACMELDFNAVLRGLPLPAAVHWPPQTLEAATHLEWWMTITAEGAIQAVEKAIDLNKVHHMLDAAGGDGTMACEFARHHPNLNVTVFNLPNSAYLARTRIAQQGLTERIAVVEGDFLSENPLPSGFEVVLWSRVFSDWSSEIVVKLMKKTREALQPGGRIIICEPMLDDNRDLAIAWEFRYLFYDDFGVAVYKTKAQYESLLTEAGFKVSDICDLDDESFYTTIIATRT
jgi:SAM-dependent methyltransferase